MPLSSLFIGSWKSLFWKTKVVTWTRQLWTKSDDLFFESNEKKITIVPTKLLFFYDFPSFFHDFLFVDNLKFSPWHVTIKFHQPMSKCHWNEIIKWMTNTTNNRRLLFLIFSYFPTIFSHFQSFSYIFSLFFRSIIFFQLQFPLSSALCRSRNATGDPGITAKCTLFFWGTGRLWLITLTLH